ncbi:MAG: VOC family protein [Saprospiraceae bacterium]|nr:VOC family protein [Saprospiraceae bacterium]
MSKPVIKVSATIGLSVLRIWPLWTTPSHIIKWNFASPDWHTPRASFDLQVGGKFTSRMEAKDGSSGLEFEGILTEVIPLQKIAYTKSDNRKVVVTFQKNGDQTFVTEEFEAESENSLELQEMGWQSILINFKAYAESYKGLDLHPCIWLDEKGKEAADLYLKAFKPSVSLSGNAVTTVLEIKGNKFMTLNGGPTFSPNASISFMVSFTDESELESTWNLLIQDGEILIPLAEYPWSPKYGFCQDQYGVSWQLIKAGFANTGQNVAPSMMFAHDHAGKAEEAIQFYTGIFPHSYIHSINRFKVDEEDVEGTVKHAMFILSDKVFTAMDSSAPQALAFNEGVSIVIPCKTQEEIDYYWTNLTQGGEEGKCGWLKDKYGVSWQVVPSILGSLLTGRDKGPGVMNAFLKMKKIDIETLLKA